MEMMRQMVVLLMTALVIMTGASSIAIASNEIEHQKHDIHATSDNVRDVAANDGRVIDHGDIPARNSMPDHDHEACTIHACPALSSEMSGVLEPLDVLRSALVWPEDSLIWPAHTDDLQKPPRS